jgi:hypothetical protein
LVDGRAAFGGGDSDANEFGGWPAGTSSSNRRHMPVMLMANHFCTSQIFTGKMSQILARPKEVVEIEGHRFGGRVSQ